MKNEGNKPAPPHEFRGALNPQKEKQLISKSAPYCLKDLLGINLAEIQINLDGQFFSWVGQFWSPTGTFSSFLFSRY